MSTKAAASSASATGSAVASTTALGENSLVRCTRWFNCYSNYCWSKCNWTYYSSDDIRSRLINKILGGGSESGNPLECMKQIKDLQTVLHFKKRRSCL